MPRYIGLRKKYHKAFVGSRKDPCPYCGNKAVNMDHIIPKAKGGDDKMDNLVPTCYSCNNEKADSSILMALLNPRIRRKVKFTLATERNKRNKIVAVTDEEKWLREIADVA